MNYGAVAQGRAANFQDGLQDLLGEVDALDGVLP